MIHKRGGGAPILLLLAAIVVAGGYSAYAANGVYQDFTRGRADLSAAQAAMTENSPDAAAIQAAQLRLAAAQQAFLDAQRRAQGDPALRLYASLPASGPQVAAALRLSEIGADISRAGLSAATIASGLVALRQAYQRPLTAADLPALLARAQALTGSYQGSIDQIGAQLKAAHAARAQVTTTNLVPPLQRAYDQVDQALDAADAAFIRYQDVRQVLADFLGVALSG